MLGDLFWNIATSMPVLGSIGLVLGAALVVGYFPLLKWIPTIGQYVPVARLVVLLAAALLCFLIGFRVSDEREEAKSLKLKLAAASIDLTAAHDAADKADAARKESAAKATAAEKRIADYADELKKRPNAACTLVPADFARSVPNDRKRTR